MLAAKWDASPAEIAGWVMLGPNLETARETEGTKEAIEGPLPNTGGLAAYFFHETSAEYRQFDFALALLGSGDSDYLRVLQQCWFVHEDLDTFKPTHRFLTRAALIERWSKLPSNFGNASVVDAGASADPNAIKEVTDFLNNQIRAEHLTDLHPALGLAHLAVSHDPVTEDQALFFVNEVEAIELAHLAVTETEEVAKPPVPGITRNQVIRIFQVRPKTTDNVQFWGDKLSHPSEWLRPARMTSGSRGISSLWNPVLLAHALLAAKYMTAHQLDAVMREHFPTQFEEWTDGTGDAAR